MTEVKSDISRKSTFSSKVKKLFGSSNTKAAAPVQTKAPRQDAETKTKTSTKVQNIYNTKAVNAKSNDACNKSINSNSPTNSHSSEFSLSKKMDRSSKSSSKASSRSSLEKDFIGGQPASSTSSNFLAPMKSPPLSTTSIANSHSASRTNIDRTLPHLVTEQPKRETTPPAPTASSAASITSAATTHQNCKRFVVLENGKHEHHLKAAKRQEKLTSMLKNIMGSQKTRGEAVSAVPDLISLSSIPATPISTIPADGTTPAGAVRVMDPPTLMSGLVRRLESKDDISFSESRKLSPKDSANELNVQLSNSTVASAAKTKACEKFAEKYGKCMEVAGRGAFGTVRICHKKSANKQEGEKLFAVKEFIKKNGEDAQKYEKRLTAEFCISSSLHHTNIVGTIDLLKDAKGDYLQVMEYCPGGDLFSLIIAAGKLEYLEADCFFKQLLKGVVYMHDMGVCHRDLKPENLLLTSDGTIKITDFGSSECFKMAWERDIHLSGGICGSSPYIAPEEYSQEEFDPRAIDIWACGVIYMAMRTGRQLWSIAMKEDQFYYKYLRGRKEKGGYKPIEMMKRARCRNVIYSMLDPSPARRITGKQILNSEWGREIKCCHESRAIKV